MSSEKRDWRELCEAASKEQDPEKLRVIISELIRALDERKRRQYPPETQSRKALPQIGARITRIDQKKEGLSGQKLTYRERESFLQNYPYSFPASDNLSS